MRRKVDRDEVARELLPGSSRPLLQELHLLTRDGDLNADSLRKLKQVNHLVRLLTPAVDDALSRFGDPVLVDCGSGKGYLGFILYEVLVGPAGKGTLLGIESRPELARACTERAARLGYERMRFLASDVADAPVPPRVHLVTALHACDTATDDAIRFALAKQAKFMVLVPCCQAEVASVLRQHKNASFGLTPLSELWRHPIHTREFGSQVTNALRCLQLEANGYQVTVTELVGWEHSMKNELIVARHTGQARRNAAERLAAILHELNLDELRGRFLAGGN